MGCAEESPGEKKNHAWTMKKYHAKIPYHHTKIYNFIPISWTQQHYNSLYVCMYTAYYYAPIGRMCVLLRTNNSCKWDGKSFICTNRRCGKKSSRSLVSCWTWRRIALFTHEKDIFSNDSPFTYFSTLSVLPVYIKGSPVFGGPRQGPWFKYNV